LETALFRNFGAAELPDLLIHRHIFEEKSPYFLVFQLFFRPIFGVSRRNLGLLHMLLPDFRGACAP